MSLVERDGRTFLRPQAVVRDKGLAHNKRNVRKPDISNPKKKDFEHIKLPAKLLDYFLRSNKSNINQVTDMHIDTGYNFQDLIRTFIAGKTN